MLPQVQTVYRVAKAGFTQGRPLSLVYLNTMKCNARCKMCLYWNEVWGPDSKNRTTMTLEQIDRFTKSMGQLLKVEICGGEPFIRKDIGETLLIMLGNCRPVTMTLSSNGTLPQRIIPAIKAATEKFPSTHIRMNVSVHGYQEKHDEIVEVPGAYERCRETFEKLMEVKKKNKNLAVSISPVLSNYNRADFSETLSKLQEDFCPDHINLLLVRGNTPEAEARDVSLKDYEEAVRKARQEISAKSNGESSFPLRFLGEVLHKEVTTRIAETVREKRQVIPCVGGTKFILIDDEGTILPCDVFRGFLSLNPTKELASANMASLADFNYSVPDAMASAQARKVAKFVQDGKCHCTSECLMVSSILTNPKLYPKLGLSALSMLRNGKNGN